MNLTDSITELKKLFEVHKPIFKAASPEEVARRPDLTPYKVFEFDIWNMINADELHNHLDKLLEGDLVAMDVSYRFLSISSDGIIKVKANYTPETL